MRRFESNNLKACCLKSIHCYIVHLRLLKYQKWRLGLLSRAAPHGKSYSEHSLVCVYVQRWSGAYWTKWGKYSSKRKTLQLHSILSYPPKSCPALYLEVVHSSIAQFTGNKVIKLFTFGTSVEARVWGSAAKSHNSLITLYMYAIMSFNTILSCISKIGYPPFSPTKGEASMERPVPPFIKASEKAPLF